MKSTGIVRKLDELGRVVLPIEIRRAFDLKERDAVEIYVEGDRIILQKYEPNCCFCGEMKNLSRYKGKPVCRKCIQAMHQMVSE
ncbi:MAG: AbrB/MazE/SpoVT family DNA-binding domain-containing protein [Oscillospiraceae bacterium]